MFSPLSIFIENFMITLGLSWPTVQYELSTLGYKKFKTCRKFLLALDKNVETAFVVV
jgi:hypothetical protein